MDPSAVRELLLNLKLQLLALPSLARWGVLTFAGIIILREGITLAWNARERRRAITSAGAGKQSQPAIPAGSSSPRGALPAPDPLAQPMPEMQSAVPEARKPQAH